ncbi:MAG: DNA-directed RNA polymerase subunit beta [Phycisphaerae bacterium]|nr:DNA-directed RNA polymerase subunit beta [Phycisphaerae bacterium]NUQ45623.1 DNA-directed RNA polymerase subunit beta [Phycisphaerae bacterium]
MSIIPAVPTTVRSFSRIGDAAPIPNLIEIQTESYKRFLQADTPPEQRRNQGLESLLREVFPITSYDENIELQYLDYTLGKPRYTPDECRQLRLTYGMPLRIRCRYVRKDTETVREERIYLGDIPIMIGGGEFIINGAERVIVSQLHRSPGVDFVIDSAEGDRPLHGCRVIPERGSWIEINVTRKDVLAVRIDQSSKIPATMFLRAFDARFSSDAAIIRTFHETKVLKVAQLKPDMYAVSDVFTSPDSSEPAVRAGCPLGDKVGEIQQSDIKQLEVIERVPDPLILNTLVEDSSRSHEDALMKLYQRLRPGNPVQLDKAVKLFHEKFFDPNRYRLGKVGRFRINRKFGLCTPTTVHTLTALDLVACLRFLLDLRGQNQVGHAVVRREPFELCLQREVERLAEQLKGYQSSDRAPMHPKEGLMLGSLDGLKGGRRKSSPSDVIEELGRQLRSISDTPTEWVPPDSLNAPWFRRTTGRSETDREQDIVRAAKDYVVAVIRTRAEPLLAAISEYTAELKRDDAEYAQLEYMNYFPAIHPVYVFNEAEAKRLSGAQQSEVHAKWKELFGGEKHVAFFAPEQVASILERPAKDSMFSRGSVSDFGYHNSRVVVTEDDIDHLGNRRMRTIDELACDELRKGLLKLRRTVTERMSMKDPDQLAKVAELINTKAVGGAIEFFFGRGELSQVVDQTNPLSQLTHERRLSALGPGGLNRKRAGFEVRDVHISHYGRICPIETPEGTNIGLIASLSIYSSVDEYGFLITPYRKVDRGGKVDANVMYLRADEEMKSILAPPDVLAAGGKKIEGETVIARARGELQQVGSKDVEYVDISPKQTVGVSASLIPFLEHDDANRALMGSNMQRQAVPLLISEPPVVATGMEKAVAANSGMVVRAEAAGTVTYVDATRIVLDETEEYVLRKFHGLNERTCLNQTPLVKLGQKVKKGQIIADGPACRNGELSLGRNVLVAFMTYDGYNFEDAILISERLVKNDTFTSIHIDSYEVEIRETKLGKEEFTRDIPNVSERMLRNLDEHGVVRVGTVVGPGDILVGKVSPKSKSELSPEEKLLHAIFGRAGEDVKNDSLEMPSGENGIVIDTKRFSRRTNMTEEQKKMLQQRIRAIRDEANARIIAVFKKMIEEIESITEQAIIDPNTRQKVGKSDNPDVIMEQIGEPDKWMFDIKWVKPASARDQVEPIYNRFWPRIMEQVEERERRIAQLKRGDELASGVLEMVKVYVATKRSLSVGDKMAGRHGNKGVIAKILPEEDMPFIEDGTPIDILLNPLGVPSRMNVGQILETHLGWAARVLGFQAVTPVFDGATEDEIHAALAEANEHVQRRRQDATATPTFGDTGELLAEMPAGGKTYLYDGRTGERFDQKVTAGFIYMMKLHHLVDDKIHARSTGPYSLITQQPLGGKARTGGQRFGEMEVWGLEAYGAAYNLQELLTVKSDDVEGRTKIYESMVKGLNTLEAGTPVSFDVLCCEIRGLGMNIQLEKKGALG